MPTEPQFSQFTDPNEQTPPTAMYSAMKGRDSLLGMLGGGAAGGMLGKHLSQHLSELMPHGSPAAITAMGLGGGALLGGMAGLNSGIERSQAHATKNDQHVRDRERMHEHRVDISDQQQAQKKELLNMRKQASTLEGVMFAAMVDELQHIHREKVAIGLPQIGGFLGNVGAKALTGITGMAAKASPQIGQAVSGGLMRAGQAVGGGANLSKMVGGGLAGAGALAAGGMVGGAMGGGRQR